jgi:hypothetical protein
MQVGQITWVMFSLQNPYCCKCYFVLGVILVFSLSFKNSKSFTLEAKRILIPKVFRCKTVSKIQ